MNITCDQLFEALKAFYEVDDDECVEEILYQSDDVISEVVAALKLIQPEQEPFVAKSPSLSVMMAALDKYEKDADECPEMGMLEAYKTLLAESGAEVADE